MKVSILGFGTVGRGVWEMIENSSDFQIGPVLVLPKEVSQPFHVTDISKITDDSSVDAVVECMGGIDAAFKFVSLCLKASKSVVTSNKALVAAKGLELQKLADEHDCAFIFSAACGGAIPVLHNIAIAKQTDSIISCKGIMNGTTNFILCGLKEGKFCDYSQALKKAQELGYAEADPTADVSGMDTLRKVMLLSAVAFDKLPSSGLCREGIENIDSYKDEGIVKLVGQCGLNTDGSVYAYVEPVVCDEKSSLSHVESNYNQISYIGKNCGLISLSGQGAGRYPTASAVLRDLTAIKNGEKHMLSSSCKEVVAHNENLFHRYVVFTDGKREEVFDSVQKMHEKALNLRNKGCKVFFAQIGE